MGLEKDLPPGEQLLVLFRPFLESLAASDLSPKTIQKHVDNVWTLGGEFIRDLHNDPSLRKKPVDRVLSQMIEYGGPLLYHGGEDQQRSFDSVRGGIKGNHFRRVERVPAAEKAGNGHTSAVAAGKGSGSRSSGLFPAGEISG